MQPISLNRDIKETLSTNATSDLEETIFLTVDKLLALSSVQNELETNGCIMPPQTRAHYAMVIDELLHNLREQLIQRFD